MKVTDAIMQRFSPLAFTDEIPGEEILMQLFESARWAPSAFNEQPWRFVCTSKKEPEKYSKLFDCLVDANKEWAKTAPVLILVMAKKNFSYNSKPNYFHMYDTGMAVSNLIISAMEKGIYVHQMGGFSAEKARENFNIPDEYAIISVAALGYQGDIAVLPAALQEKVKKARTRKPLGELFLV
ncbi:MAG TPA: nitroreductase family protein [Bacteroidales bacterium]|nr:nitroreductase family protein [Bacteroidales bacterium]HOH83077.1 nitroreductase family protein [Bacteroidales bacterium]HPB24684.1 nitroreductase family protein [Bacteroidales bacterium]HPI29109.1 nitroreductase family protein [Bacteroidales bacterium]HQN15481.1 nitroreductase family protein [Bacteroidales bacterium]